MEQEVERKVFYRKDFKEVKDLEVAAEEFAKKMREQYTDCMVTKEYVNVNDILVRVTTVKMLYRTNKILERQRIREREMSRGRGGRQRSR